MVVPLGDHVADALMPSSVAALDVAASCDLRIVLTLIKFSESMAHLMTPKGTKLTRLPNGATADYHYGTTVTGVLLRPIDEHGNHLITDGTRISLRTVYSVAILAVGLSLKEATG